LHSREAVAMQAEVGAEYGWMLCHGSASGRAIETRSIW
jgi:hypothetical protein